eukprot:scaffold198_cov352-Prasinococcus_capsulatus_cf.AAC.6
MPAAHGRTVGCREAMRPQGTLKADGYVCLANFLASDNKAQEITQISALLPDCQTPYERGAMRVEWPSRWSDITACVPGDRASNALGGSFVGILIATFVFFTLFWHSLLQGIECTASDQAKASAALGCDSKERPPLPRRALACLSIAHVAVVFEAVTPARVRLWRPWQPGAKGGGCNAAALGRDAACVAAQPRRTRTRTWARVSRAHARWEQPGETGQG